MTPLPPGRLVLLGHPVAHSLSPAFQNAALRAAGIALRYVALDIPPQALLGVLANLRDERGAGNATIPHKEALARHCQRLTPLARRVGAANVFWHDSDGSLSGDNTDVGGFDAMAESLGVDRRGAVVACLGAGGAGAAVCAAVEKWDAARVRVWSRRADRARSLVMRFPHVASIAESAETALDGANVAVNATPLGLGDLSHPAPLEALARDARVMDLVYRPGETSWVREARARGHTAADGREMLLHQGALAFACWFGFAPDLGAMRQALDEAAA